MCNPFHTVGVVLSMLVAAGCGGPSDAFTSQLGASGGAQDGSAGIARDGNGHVFVAGSTNGSFPGLSHAGGSDVVVVQFDVSGAVQWIRQLGTAGADYTRAIATDGDGNVYVAGITDGSFTGFTSAGEKDAFVIKLDGSGALQWIRQLGTAGIDEGRAIATDGNGNVYLVGSTRGSFPGCSNAGQDDPFIIKLSGDGALQWVQQPGSPGWEQASGVAMDGSGNIFVVGPTNGSFPGFPTVNDALIKYDASGAQQWIRYLETLGGPTAVTTDRDGNIYVSSSQSNGEGHSLTISKRDPEGARLWVHTVTGERYGSSTRSTGVATDSDGNVFVTGYTNGSLPGETSSGESDLVLIKFDGGGTQQWLTQYGTSSTEYATGVVVDESGSLFVSGTTAAGGFGKSDNDLLLMKFDGQGTPNR